MECLLNVWRAQYQELGLWKVNDIIKDLGNLALKAVEMVLELIF